MADKTDKKVTEEDAAAVEKLKHEAEQTKHEEALAAVSAIEAEPTPEEAQQRQLSEVEAQETQDDTDTADATDAEQTTEVTTDTEGAKQPVADTPHALRTSAPWWKRRKSMIPLAIGGVLLIVAVLQLVQPVRFATFGWVQRPAVVTVYDTTSKAPLDSATVEIDGKSHTTNTKGEIRVALAVGAHQARITKENYKSVTMPLTVDVFSTVQVRSDLTPTGKPVTLTIIDRVTGKPVVGAALDGSKKTLAKTDAKGVARVVVPLDKKSLAVTVKADKYRVSQATITLETKELQVVPDGAVFFLSKASGRIDVVKTNLDGSDRKVILAGTGAEEDRATTLLASRDWQKLMLLSKRDGSKRAGLTIVDGASGATKAIDQTNTDVTLIGWSGHNFVYMTSVPGTTTGRKAGAVALKSYNADTDKVTVLDQNVSEAGDTMWEDLTTGYITDKGIVYGKVWNTVYTTPRTTIPNGKQATIMQVQADGTNKKMLAGFDAVTTTWLEAKLYEPQGIYFKIATTKDTVYSESFGEVEDGAYKAIKEKPANFDEAVYPTFLVSPNGSAVLWAEPRDGKQVLFTGDRVGQNKQEIAKASEFIPYGWLGDDKVLVQKGGSELYVTTLEALKQGLAPLKIGDYHKAQTIAGYGYGYGAQ